MKNASFSLYYGTLTYGIIRTETQSYSSIQLMFIEHLLFIEEKSRDAQVKGLAPCLPACPG